MYRRTITVERCPVCFMMDRSEARRRGIFSLTVKTNLPLSADLVDARRSRTAGRAL